MLHQVIFLFWVLLIPHIFNNDSCPVGTIRVGGNFFVDRNEISIQDYKEYLYWISRIFGENSDLHRRSIPDLFVFDSLAKTIHTTSKDFFTNPNYSRYPVVGISLQQASNYCQWRSDRVYELMLIQNGVIGFDRNQTHSTFFTIKKHLEDNPGETLMYPAYRLPTPEEWDSFSQHNKVRKKYEQDYKLQTEFSGNKILNLFGSVSEMTSVIGISKGGSYKNHLTAQDNWIDYYDKPTDGMGFRCVCSWQK